MQTQIQSRPRNSESALREILQDYVATAKVFAELPSHAFCFQPGTKNSKENIIEALRREAIAKLLRFELRQGLIETAGITRLDLKEFRTQAEQVKWSDAQSLEGLRYKIRAKLPIKPNW